MEYTRIQRIKNLLIHNIKGEKYSSSIDENDVKIYKTVSENIYSKEFMYNVLDNNCTKRNFKNEWQKVKKITIGKRKHLYMRPAIAASIFIFLLIGILFYNNTKDSIQYNYYNINDATVYWANGEVTSLSNNYIENKIEDVKILEISSSQEEKTENLYNRIVTPRGSNYIISLNDGTKIHLNSESELIIPSNYDSEHRNVELIGSAYFDVAHDSLSHFILKTGNIEINVLGTSFDVRSQEGENTVLTTLVNGKVEINSPQGNIVLKPGMQAKVEKDGKFTIKYVNTDRYTAWVNDRFIFENERIEEIIKEIENWYNVVISIQNKDIADIRITMNIPRYKDIASFIKAIEKIEKVKFIQDGDALRIIK